MDNLDSNLPLPDCLPSKCVFRFEFKDGYFIISICIRAESYDKAIDQLTLILGDSVFDYVSVIHRIA